MEMLQYIGLGIDAVFQGPVAFAVLGFGIPVAILMVFLGFLLGVAVGATPGLAGPMAMAISLPMLISVFGFQPPALLPVLGFLIGVMKGATVGGAVPAILFNTPGTPDAYLTTFDGHPLAQKGQAYKALRVAHVSSAAGDTFSDVVLIVCAPFLAIMVEAYLDLPEKTALLILSMAFIAAAVGGSPARGLISAGLGLLAAFIGTGEDFYPRLSLGMPSLGDGLPIVTVILGVLILGEIFSALEQEMRDRVRTGAVRDVVEQVKARLTFPELRAIAPYVARSAVIGTIVGALPGIGSTLAATLGYTSGRLRHKKKAKTGATPFGAGAIEGIASTEAANSAVSGANLIPVLSLGIPGNAAAVFLILAVDTIDGFNPGPAVFRVVPGTINPEMVVAFGLFTLMMVANLFNWVLGGKFMRLMGVMTRIPKHRLLPVVLLLTLTAIYVQENSMSAIWFAIGFGFLGYFMRRLSISPLPFVIAFILGGRLETTGRQAFSATGSDPWFLFSSVTSVVFLLLAVWVIAYFSLKKGMTE